MFSIPFLGMKSFLRKFEGRFQIVDHDHLDGVMLRQIIADTHADFASLAAVDGHECGLGSIVVENGVRFRAILRAEPASGFTADGLINMSNKIQGTTPLRLNQTDAF